MAFCVGWRVRSAGLQRLLESRFEIFLAVVGRGFRSRSLSRRAAPGDAVAVASCSMIDTLTPFGDAGAVKKSDPSTAATIAVIFIIVASSYAFNGTA